jgi:hypothetical protein
MAPTRGPEQSQQAHRPVLILAWFEIGSPPEHAQLAVFIDAVKAAGLPADLSTHIGTYGPNQATAAAVKALSAIYAPLFSIQPSTSKGAYGGRHLTPENNALLDPKYDRPLPLAVAGKPLPASDYLNWGRELGRRFRDQMRTGGRSGAPIATTWQFDEILREVVDGPNADAHKLYAAGILDGLRLGRPELGDATQQGIVFAARATLARLPRLAAPTGSPVARLWGEIDKSAHSYVGEEYMNFDGDPTQAAAVNAVGQKQLLAAGPTRRRIGMKYVAGMTPGQVHNSSIGGNVLNWSRSRVNTWRLRYVAARRAQTALAGFAQFDFTAQNAQSEVVTDAVAAAIAGIHAKGPAIS